MGDADGSAMGSLLSSLSPAIHTAMAFILSKVICINFIKRPFQDLTRPHIYDVNNAVDVRIPVLDDAGNDLGDLGAWFIRPFEDDMAQAQSRVDQIKAQSNAYLADTNEVVVLYLHGNSETRSQSHRRGLYHVFQAMGLPVLAVDYRGFGDSSSISMPSETSLVRDAATAFKWLKERLHPDTKIVVWGHSLGTGITAKMGATLNKEQPRPTAYVLEAPFNNMLDEVRSFKIANVLEYTGLDIEWLLKEADQEFRTDDNIKFVDEPVMIFNAEDDGVVPCELGKSLYETVKDQKPNISIHTFGKTLGLGHDNIYMENQMQVKFLEFLTGINSTEKP